MNINLQPYLVAYLLASVRVSVRSHAIPTISGSWALPLRHERITSWDNPITFGAQQLAQVCQYFRHRPIALFDSEYGCAPLVIATAAIAADKLMRLRSNRCLWSAPASYGGKGRPQVHGKQFKLNDSSTWWEPEQTLESVKPELGKIRLRNWDNLHFRGSPKHSMTLILVERLDTVTGQLKNQPLWLAWVGLQMPPLLEIWQLYLRRESPRTLVSRVPNKLCIGRCQS